MLTMPKILATISGIAFALHLVWENAQAPLFAGYTSFGQHLLICLYGTAGDVLITLIVYGLVSLLKYDLFWPLKVTAQDLVALALVGFFVAAGIEYRALALDRWTYTPSMPIVPYLHVGLSPLVQMTLLLPVTFYLTRFFLPTNSGR